MIDVDREIEMERKYLTTEIADLGKRLGAVPALRAFLERANTLPSIEDIHNVYISSRVVFYLLEGHETSTFPRDLVREFGGKLEKYANFDQKTLNCGGEIAGFNVGIHGYKPESCEIVYDDILVPATPEHIVKRARLVCGEEIEKNVDA